MKSKLVIFDFADTIARLSPSKEEILHKFILEELNLDISLKYIEEIYHYSTNLIFYSSVNIQKLDSKKEFYIKFNNDILSLLGIAHLLDAEKLFHYFNENGQHWILKDGVKKLFINLKQNGYLLSLVSNFDERLNQILKNLEIDELLDSKFISQEVGLEKPNIEFLKLSLKKHNIEAENIFYIGDSYHLDYLPGLKLGVNTYLLDEKNFYITLSNRVCSLEKFYQIIMKKDNK